MEPASRKSNLIWLIFIFASTFIAYIPALRAGWIWDDDIHVTNNIHLRTLHGLAALWLHPGIVPQYYPLTHTTFWIEHHLWGAHPLGYHLDNVLLHLANALLIGMLLRRLNIRGYAIAAAIFALHPVQVESVAWVTERKNVLSTIFYLAGMWVALDVWNITPSHSAGMKPRSISLKYLLCLTLFICALLSKTVTASLPAAILLLIWWKQHRITLRTFSSLIPFFIIGAAFGWHTSWMEKHVVGANGSEWNWTFPQRLLIASHAIWFYLGKLIWPHPLIFSYPKWNLILSEQWMYPIGLIVLIVAAVRATRSVLLALLFFCVTLFPALGFANVFPMRFSFVADHFQYLASIGPIALAAAFISRPIAAAPLAVLLGVLTWQQSRTYLDVETLWRDVAAKNPGSFIAHGNLGSELIRQGKLDEAGDQLNLALKIWPHYVEARLAIGSIAEARGNGAQAEAIYLDAEVDRPESPLPYWNLGNWYHKHGEPEKAKLQFSQAIKRLGNPSGAAELLGEVALGEGKYEEAEADFRQALSFDPDRADAHVNLASLYLAGDPPNLPLARIECQTAIEIDPTNPAAWNDLGITNIEDHQIEAAISDFKKALECDPNFAMARANLGKLGQH